MAGGVSESVIEEIKARTSLADLVAGYGVAVRHSGGSAKACCPFHNEKTPSFHINESKGLYHCFGCGESGDAIKFVQKMDGLTFIEAVRKLASACGVEVVERVDPDAERRKRLYSLMAEVAQFYRRCLREMKSAATAREYLASRELDERLQDEYLIGYAPDGASTMVKWAAKYGYTPEELDAAGIVKSPRSPDDSPYHRFSGRIMFSIRDRQGRVVAFSGRQIVERKNSGKYVNSPETLVFKKSNVLYGFDRAAAAIAKSPHREVIVCEGQIDCIRLQSGGFPTAVAGQGTAFTEEHVKMLRRVADAAVLVYDDDEAGHKATVRAAGMLLAAEMPVRVVSLPGGDDPDSFLRTKGAKAFQSLLDGAESVIGFQCRAERAKENSPDSIDAVSRVTRSVLATIAACPNAVLRASMIGEAAENLHLPVAALAEELAKTKSSASAHAARAQKAATPSDDFDVDIDAPEEEPADDGEAIAGEDAAAAEPPSERETALMAFLLTHEHEVRELDALVGTYLPERIVGHPFTSRFIAAWRIGATCDDDVMASFAASLGATERSWFDAVLLESGRCSACSLAATDILKDFIRQLWCDALRRERGSLPASGDEASERRRLEIAADIRRISLLPWAEVRERLDGVRSE